MVECGLRLRRVVEATQVRRGGEHLLDARPQAGVTSVGLVEKRGAVAQRATQGREKDRLSRVVSDLRSSGLGGYPTWRNLAREPITGARHGLQGSG